MIEFKTQVGDGRDPRKKAGNPTDILQDAQQRWWLLTQGCIALPQNGKAAMSGAVATYTQMEFAECARETITNCAQSYLPF